MKDKINNILKADVTVKSLSIIVTVFMLLTAVPMFVGGSVSAQETNQSVEKQFVFSAPEVVPAKDGYVQLLVDGALETQKNPGEPTLPLCVYSFELPYGSTGVTAELIPLSVESMVLADKIVPGPVPYLAGEGPHPLARVLLKVYSLMTSLKPPEVAKGMQFDAMVESIYDSNAGYGEAFSYNTYVGVNAEGALVTKVVCHIMPVTFSSVASGILSYFTDATVKVSYILPVASTGSLADVEQYDLLILTPKGYQSLLQPLVDHKESMGLKTKLVTLDEIYSNAYFEISGLRDNQEIIKYFIYQAKLNWNVVYVLAVGGYRSYSGLNNPNLQFPVQMSYNQADEDPWYTCDQYYSCSVRYDPVKGAVFDDWDSNGNGIPGEWNKNGFDVYDTYPEVFFGRWACTNRKEVQTMVDKTIYYETNTYGQEWFNTLLTVSGDAFGDHPNLGQDWDTALVPDGDYTIYGQSTAGTLYGPIDQVPITVDHSSPSVVTPGNDEQNIIEPLDPEQKTKYPGKPVAEIVVPSINDILGNTDVNNIVTSGDGSEFYGYNAWADVHYNSGVITIKAKSYDPSPHVGGVSSTQLHVWINDSGGHTVKNFALKSASEEWEGEASVEAAANLIPSFNHTKLWTSNGAFYSMWDVLNEFSKGYGIVYFNGHSSVMSWADHYPGIPGGRDDGMVSGFAALNLRYSGLQRYQAQPGDPMFPEDLFTNGNKLPFVLLLGCHSGMFDTSPMRLLSDPNAALWGVGHIGYYGSYVPEGIAWNMVRQPQGGSIATVGFTGLGYGGPTDEFMADILDQYDLGAHNAGVAFTLALNQYAAANDPLLFDQIARKTWEESVLLGDPSLMLGGYPQTGATTLSTSSVQSGAGLLQQCTDVPPVSSFIRTVSTGDVASLSSATTYKVTSNLLNDTNPEGMVYNGSSDFDRFIVSYTRQTPEYSSTRNCPGFAYSTGGALWTEVTYGTPDTGGHTSLYTFTDAQGKQYTIAGAITDPAVLRPIFMGDITNPSTWTNFGRGWMISNNGEIALTGYLDSDGNLQYAGMWGQSGKALILIDQGVNAGGEQGQYDITTNVRNFNAHADQSTGWHYFVCQNQADTGGIVVAALPPGILTSSFRAATFASGFGNPRVITNAGLAYIVSESGAAVVCRNSINNGITWSSPVTVNVAGSHPQIIVTTSGNVECYFVNTDQIYKSVSTDHGATWSARILVGDAQTNAALSSPFQVVSKALVFNKKDAQGDLYAEMLNPTKGVSLSPLKLKGKGTIVTTMSNAGCTYLDDLTWMIQIQGDSPLGQFLGGGNAIILELFRGRVLSGGFTSGDAALSLTETEELASGPVFGIGHVMITVQVINQDDVVLAQTSKDAFLLGGRILLDYLVEG